MCIRDRCMNAERCAEMVLMRIGGGDRTRLARIADGSEQFELELLLALVGGQHPASPSEERIIGGRWFHVEPQGPEQPGAAFDPFVTKCADLARGPQPHVLPHPEELHARRIWRRFVAEAP